MQDDLIELDMSCSLAVFVPMATLAMGLPAVRGGCLPSNFECSSRRTVCKAADSHLFHVAKSVGVDESIYRRLPKLLQLACRIIVTAAGVKRQACH